MKRLDEEQRVEIGCVCVCVCVCVCTSQKWEKRSRKSKKVSNASNDFFVGLVFKLIQLNSVEFNVNE